MLRRVNLTTIADYYEWYINQKDLYYNEKKVIINNIVQDLENTQKYHIHLSNRVVISIGEVE